MKHKLYIDRRIFVTRLQELLLSAIVYFCFDYFVQLTHFIKFEPFVGLKSFLPITLGLFFGIIGIIGQLIGCTASSILLGTQIQYVITEYIIIIIPSLIAWIFWHIESHTHKLHFRYLHNYIRYISIVVISFFFCGYFAHKIVGGDSFKHVFIWGFSMSIIVGIPVDIIFSGLMCFNPILPPIKVGGVKIAIIDDLRAFLYNDPLSLATFNEKLENFAESQHIGMKRLFEIQNCIEELYLRIMHERPDAKIDLRASYDIIFSVEFIYIGDRFNPFYLGKNVDETEIAGLRIVKHRALLSSYKYICGENLVHIVI